jgi:hypothetical protein
MQSTRRERREAQREIDRLKDKVKKLEAASPHKPWYGKLFAGVNKIYVAILGIITLLGLLALIPRPTVSPADYLDKNNPFVCTFTIANNSPMTLRHVTARVLVGNVSMGVSADKPPNKADYLGSGGFVYPEWQDHNLETDEKFTITTEHLFRPAPGAHFGTADIAIAVSFKPWFLPITREKVFRFVSHKQTDGSFIWYSAPLD